MSAPTASEFARYYAGVRARTRRLVPLIPEDRLEWSITDGKFTFGDILRHLAATERFMWAENALGKPAAYPGHGMDLAQGYEATVSLFDRLHQESLAIFAGLSDQDMLAKRATPSGHRITLWKWLRAMTEHEAHHRGQLYVYLGHLGIATPPVFGLTSEEIRDGGAR